MAGYSFIGHPAFSFFNSINSPMRYIYSLMLMYIGIHPVLSQKHDYLWPLGLGPGWSDYNFFLDFNGVDSPSVVIRTDTMSTGLYSASFCNEKGEIILYSNGLWILNKNGEFVENSLGLNPSLPDWQNYNYRGGQSGFFLEKPNNSDVVYFISLDFGLHPAQEWPYMFVGQNLMVATIDLTANNGAGKVIEKNKILLTGTLMSPAACRHANGRDWWILVSNADENLHYRILLTPERFSAPATQSIGTKPNPIPFDGGNSSNQIVGNCFSPHGRYYADINDMLGFSIFEFDRCTGLLSSERRVAYPSPLPNYPTWYRNGVGTGAVFSPNDSLFYKTTTFDPSIQPWTNAGRIPYLLQYDLSLPILSEKVDTINTSDWSFPFNLSDERFYGAELGPDGRIYVVHEGVSYCTVQYPNVRGRDCKFVHDKPFFGVVIGSAIPYMPNYRLGPLDGSLCDSLGLNNIPVANFRMDDTLSPFARYFYDLSHHEPAEWNWSFGDGQTSTEQSPLHQYDSAGIYEVCLTVSNQYGSNTLCKTLYLGVSSTGNPVEGSQLRVFPNPATNVIHIPFEGPYESLELFDALGRKMSSGNVVASEGRLTLPIGHLSPGLYYLRLRERGRIWSGRFVKE